MTITVAQGVAAVGRFPTVSNVNMFDNITRHLLWGGNMIVIKSMISTITVLTILVMLGVTRNESDGVRHLCGYFVLLYAMLLVLVWMK